jgi:hypothetical protein
MPMIDLHVPGEVPEGNWGAAGTPVRFAQLLEVSAAERAGAVASTDAETSR